MFDLIIIGGSAAATAAGVYAARRGLKFKIITKEFGGEVATSGEIGNWPGINMTDGVSLAQQFKDQLMFYKVDLEEGVEVAGISKQSDGSFCIAAKKDGPPATGDKMSSSPDGKTCDYTARTVILATGVHPRELNIPGEKEFRNRGVSYCTTCDGPIFKGKKVATIGGGNSALESALMLSDIAEKVYVINKNLEFKGEAVLLDNLKSKSNVEIIYSAKTLAVNGDKFVAGLKYSDAGGEKELAVDGVFVHIGMVPNSHIAPADIVKNAFGEIKINANCETSVPGLYAAGDVTDVPFKQIVIAAGQGCIATLTAVQYLNRLQK